MLGVTLKNTKIGFGVVSDLVILVLALVAAILWLKRRTASRSGAQPQFEER